VRRIVALKTLQNMLQIRAFVKIQAGSSLCCIIFTWLKSYFNVCFLIVYVCEGSSQPIPNQLKCKKLWYRYFWLWKPQYLTLTVYVRTISIRKLDVYLSWSNYNMQWNSTNRFRLAKFVRCSLKQGWFLLL